jgi:hypothetical protein
MKKDAKKSKKQSSSAEESITADESLKRMKSFAAQRKEKFIASIKKSQS